MRLAVLRYESFATAAANPTPFDSYNARSPLSPSIGGKGKGDRGPVRPFATPLRRLAILMLLLYGGAIALALGGTDVIFDQQQLINGLSSGAIYGSIALALVMMFRATGVLNLAIGETSTLGAFIAWSLIVSAGLPYWVGLLLAAGALGLAGAALEAGVLSHLAERGPLTMIVITAGLLGLVRDLDELIWSDRPRPFPTPFHGAVLHTAGLYVTRPRLGTFLTVCAAIGLLAWLFQRTRLGLALRAAAQRPEAARLCGIPVRRMRTLGWGLATALGAVGGILIANIILLDPRMLEGGLIYALAAAALGGLDQPAGAIVGGAVVGMFDGVVGSIAPFKEIQLPVVVLLVFIVLTAWPDGLLGARSRRSI